MESKIKLWWNQFKCNHNRVDVVRWHILDYNPYTEPNNIEVKYQCNKCGKVLYLNLKGQDVQDWIHVMGEYKRVY